MGKTSLKGLFIGVVAAGALFTLSLNEANAFRSWGSSSSGSSGSWGSSSSGSWGRHISRSRGSWGSSSSGSSSSGSWGGHHRAHKHHRRARWGSSGSWGSSSSGSSSSGSWGSGASGASAPVAPTTTWRTTSGSATLAVHVPADAKVVVNNNVTKSTGTDRRFVSNGLQRGRTYTYVVEATFERDGKTVTETKTVQLTAGSTSNVVFGGSQSQEPATVVDAPTETTLIVNVPAEAKVFLAGSPTRLKGHVRNFTTTKLSSGQSWSNYVVRVELTRDGKTISQDREITLVAGVSQELTFHFETDKVAAR